MGAEPTLSVVICTRDRPRLLRRCIAAIAAQDLDATIETIVVFDREEPDRTIEVHDGPRPVRVVANRTPGLPGGRNTGVEEARGEFLGFCDDDDVWLPAKARRQIALLRERPDRDVAVCGLTLVQGAVRVERPLGLPEVTVADLLHSRVLQANFTTTIVRHDAWLERIGPADAEIPGGYAEDYEWILRAARVAPLVVVADPLVDYDWNGQSYFAGRWAMIAEALDYLLERTPEFATDRHGEARVRGQRAFALAAGGERRAARRELAATLRRNPFEPRAYLAGLVCAHLTTPERILAVLNRRGRGI
jgi:glycosyltransferase involved in cell wall biosynthesis